MGKIAGPIYGNRTYYWLCFALVFYVFVWLPSVGEIKLLIIIVVTHCVQIAQSR